MSAEDNKALVRRWIDEVWNKGNLAVTDELYAPSFANNGEPMTADQMKHIIADLRRAFPDLHITIDDVIAEGDKIAYRWTWQCTHQGDLHDPQFGTIRATGKPLTITGMTFCRIEGGKVVDDRFNGDSLGMAQQLGVIPAPEHASA